MDNNSRVIHQPININGAVSECTITIQFTSGPTVNTVPASTEMPIGKLLLRINDAAEKLSLSRTNLYKLLASGELESIKVGRSRLIPTDALESFVNHHRNSG